jgi:hypothetical protein
MQAGFLFSLPPTQTPETKPNLGNIFSHDEGDEEGVESSFPFEKERKRDRNASCILFLIAVTSLCPFITLYSSWFG